MIDKIIIYGHPFCPMVRPVRSMLNQSNIAYDYVNIHQDANARQQVLEINNGYESVPTILFPDGSTLTEPSIGQLKIKLEEMGYKITFKAVLIANIPRLIFIMIIVLGTLQLTGII